MTIKTSRLVLGPEQVRQIPYLLLCSDQIIARVSCLVLVVPVEKNKSQTGESPEGNDQGK